MLHFMPESLPRMPEEPTEESIILRDHLREKRERELRENVKTDPYEAIAAVASGVENVTFRYKQKYIGEYDVIFITDAIVQVIGVSEEEETYMHQMGEDEENESSVDRYITSMRRAIETVKKAQQAIPPKIMENLGGLVGISKTVLDTMEINACINYFESMTPEAREAFKKPYGED